MITILHTSDWHIGQTFYGHDRELEHQHFLDWLISQIEINKADALLIAGDIFDVSNPSSSAQRMFYSFIQKATTLNPHLQIIVTAGNHDSPSRIEAPLPLVEDKNVVIKGVVPKQLGEILYDDLVVPILDTQNNIACYCLAVPYLRQGDYPRIESENPYSAGVNTLYKKLQECATKLKNANQAIIAMGHLHAVNAVVAKEDHSEKMIIGGLESINPTIFEGFNYTALGHIHKAQRLAQNESIRYAGSPLPMSFAEKNYKHGIVKVVLDGSNTKSIEKIAYVPLVHLESIPKDSNTILSSADVLDLLHQLPEVVANDKIEDRRLYPYLEIKIRSAEPEPMLPKKIADILETKKVRFARIVNQFTRENSLRDEVIVSKGLKELGPLEIANQYYSNSTNQEMPDSLKVLFQEVCSELNTGGIE